MIFKGINNQKVELKITGNQFPNTQQDSLDSNWLNIFIDVQSDLGNWKTVDPSLMASEFKELIQWLKDLSVNKESEYHDLYFIEPNLGFDFIKSEDGIKYIKMIFSAESKPQSAKEGQNYFIDFQFSNEELNSMADELNDELKKYLGIN